MDFHPERTHNKRKEKKEKPLKYISNNLCTGLVKLTGAVFTLVKFQLRIAKSNPPTLPIAFQTM